MASASATPSRTVSRQPLATGAPTFGTAIPGSTAEFSRVVFALFDWLSGAAPDLTGHRGAHPRRATGEAPAP